MTHFSGLFPEMPQYATILVQHWTDERIREQYEAHYGTALGKYGYVFQSSQYPQILAVELIGEAVAMKMDREFNTDGSGKFQSVCRQMFENPNGTFSYGVMLLGAASRDIAERFQRDFGFQINQVLESLGANIRLSDHAM